MEFLKNKKILIIIIAIIILIIIGLILFFLNGKKDTRGNNYNYNNEAIQLPGTTEYKNEELSSKHCLNDICIEDATFYYNDQIGRVEYTITNTSKKTKSGYLKMVFKEQTLLIVYNDLKPNSTVKSESQYMGIEIKDKSNYELKKLTKEEISKIIK